MLHPGAALPGRKYHIHLKPGSRYAGVRAQKKRRCARQQKAVPFAGAKQRGCNAGRQLANVYKYLNETVQKMGSIAKIRYTLAAAQKSALVGGKSAFIL
ncbi:hypothetical protein [Desulfovibrio sp. ZJ200]|uniref:hypothetical protein n=1 Tax=Desulfovibrio sp. ZJ200 TaxID=2709792 RepID=UPI0013EB87E7|nr:hypothetical protein [Desulfovibrio sp. ZJ200]